MASTFLLNMIKQVKSLAEAGLVYNDNNYDTERYEELRRISLEMMSVISQKEVEVLESFFLPVNDYPTPKVDVRALILNGKREILMVKEQVDGKWTIPGGWSEIGLTASESIIKEVKEETGFIVKPTRLLAVFDKKCHPHPPEAYYLYKIIFYCEIEDGEVAPNFDIQEVGWYALNELPELSTDRIVESQLKLLIDLEEKGGDVYFD
ncbi:NUDIX hydrolase [Flavimarina sp. Hel_I_48]|uniref:NUDIX hydrolase n=1 Tax=Flavimarina sp. Hel_I_48 TaxID=1392488 RepID=UPI0004DFC724|nr:NUDIX hydrolase [Flavimarina sp. Hel_I_48]